MYDRYHYLTNKICLMHYKIFIIIIKAVVFSGNLPVYK